MFTEAGSAFFDGRDPYRVASPRGWHYLYPPLFALLVSPLRFFDTESQVLTWYFINVGLTFACFLETRRLYRLFTRETESRRGLGWGACAGLAAFLPFLDCMEAGQLGIAILYLLLVGLRLVQECRTWLGWFLAGVVLALPAAVKLVPSLPVVFVLFQHWCAALLPQGEGRRWGRPVALTAGVMAGAFFFLLAFPASLLGWQKNLAYLNVWRARVVMNERVGPNANFNVHSFRNQSLANAVYLWTKLTAVATAKSSAPAPHHDRGERIVHRGVRVVIALILSLLLAIGITVGRKVDPLDQASAYSIACCAMLLVSPLAWGHYYMATLPAALCVPMWLSARNAAASYFRCRNSPDLDLVLLCGDALHGRTGPVRIGHDRLVPVYLRVARRNRGLGRL